MAVVIRLKRIGRRLRPCYRISVADEQKAATGRTLETIGTYDPISPNPEAQHTVQVERAKFWLDRGAQPSPTVKSLLKRHGVYEGRPEPAKRTRPGRDKDTAAKRHRAERKTRLEERKAARRQARDEAKQAAKAAAAAAATESE